MSVAVIGLGTAVPAHSISQNESCDHAKVYSCANERQGKLIEELYSRTEIGKRSSVLLAAEKQEIGVEFFPIPSDLYDKGPGTAERMRTYNLHAANLSAQACRFAMQDSDINIDKISHLVTASCTGFSAPGFDVQLIESLSMNRNVSRTHIGFMGCHGAMNALRVAEGYCGLNKQATILLCATEICSVHFQYGLQRNDLIANSLFADGSAALVLNGTSEGKIKYLGSLSYVIPNSHDAITWQISNNGFVMTLSSYVRALIQRYLPGFLVGWLKQYSLTLKDIASWAVHPGGPRIINAVQTCLSLPSSSLEISRQVLAEYGNMSSPTVLFILQRLLQSGNAMPSVMLGFGPGLTIEAALFA